VKFDGRGRIDLRVFGWEPRQVYASRRPKRTGQAD
jgi:hypothetical protein